MKKYLLIFLIIFFCIYCSNDKNVESNISNTSIKYQTQENNSTLKENIHKAEVYKINLEEKIQEVEKDKSALMATMQKSKDETDKLELKLNVIKARRTELLKDIRRIEEENKKLEQRKLYLEKVRRKNKSE